MGSLIHIICNLRHGDQRIEQKMQRFLGVSMRAFPLEIQFMHGTSRDIGKCLGTRLHDPSPSNQIWSFSHTQILREKVDLPFFTTVQ